MTDAVNDTDTEDGRMVLRTVYLPPELDEKLRVHAFRSKLTKGEVIRRAIAKFLDAEAAFGEDERPATSKSAGTVKIGKSTTASTTAKAAAIRGGAKAASKTTGRIGARSAITQGAVARR